MGVSFDSSINAGHVITIVFGCIAFIMAWGKFSARLDMLELRVKTVEQALDKVATALLQIGQNDKQLAVLQSEQAAMSSLVAVLQEQIEGLRRGEGYIQARRGNVDGEYSRAGN